MTENDFVSILFPGKIGSNSKTLYRKKREHFSRWSLGWKKILYDTIIKALSNIFDEDELEPMVERTFNRIVWILLSQDRVLTCKDNIPHIKYKLGVTEVFEEPCDGVSRIADVGYFVSCKELVIQR